MEDKRVQFSIAVFFFVIAALAYFRIYFSVSFYDESGYIGIPYSFLIGAKPFFDEVATTQNVGILLTPLVKAYIHLTGGAYGLVLFFRHVYFLLTVFSSWQVFKFASHLLPKNLSMLIATVPFCFVNASMPSISYNTVGLFGIMIGLFSYMNVLNEEEPTVFDAICGTMAFGLATYGYPTLALITIPTIIYVLFKLRTASKLGPHHFWAISSIVAASFTLLILAFKTVQYAGLDNLRSTIEYYKIFGTNFGGGNKGKWIVTELMSKSYILVPILIGMMGSFFFTGRSKVRSVYLILSSALVLGLLIYEPNSPHTPMWFLIFFGICPIPFLIEKRSSIDHRLTRLLKEAWIFLLLAGFIFAWTSSNGPSNACLSMVTATLINMVALGIIWKSRSATTVLMNLEIFKILFIVIVFGSSTRFVYADAELAALTTTVQSGAFAGLRTTPERAHFIQSLTQDLISLKESTGAESVIFFNDFPGGYLLTDLQRKSQSIWTPSPELTKQYLKERSAHVLGYYKDDSSLPDIAVYIIPDHVKIHMDFTAVAKGDSVFDYFSQNPYVLVFSGKDYLVFNKKP